MTETPKYHYFQVQRGLEGLHIVSDFLEQHKGILTVSINEHNYSTGQWGRPDLVFGPIAIEVKRVEFLTKKRFGNESEMYAQMGYVSILHKSWDDLKAWAKVHHKQVMLIVVLTFRKDAPILVGFTQAQIDDFQTKQKHLKWMKVRAWDLLRQGTILKDADFLLSRMC